MERRLLIPREGAALRANNLDAWRLSMALLVIWSHSFFMWYGSEATEPLSLLLRGVYNSGNVAVLAFFTISGFLISVSYMASRSPGAFLRKRVLRIYPGYIAATLIGSLIVVPAFSSRPFGSLDAHEIGGLFSNLLLRNYEIRSDAFGGQALNGSLWSIPYEFWCYIGILLLGLVGLIRNKPLFAILAALVMLGRIVLDATGLRPSLGPIGTIFGFPYFWFMVLPSFLLGVVAHQYRAVLPRDGRLLATLVLVTVASAHLPFAYAWTRLALPPTLAYAIFYVAFDPRIGLHGAARFGDFSYGTYLYAFPIQRMLAQGLRGSIPFAAYVALSMLLALAAGVASWFLVERWFVRKAGRRPAHPLEEEARTVAP